MADPINHDATSGLATAGGEGLKWGLLGVVAAFALPALLVGGLTFAAGSAIAGALGVAEISAGVVGIASAVAGIATGAASALSVGSGVGIVSGLLGFAKGGDKVSAEKQAFRDRVHNRAQSHKHKVAKVFNDGEVTGVQEGYQVGRADGEQVGFQKGAQYGAQAVMSQIQQHVASQQMGSDAIPQSESKFSDKVASCKCESKVEMVDKQRAEAAAAGLQVG